MQLIFDTSIESDREERVEEIDTRKGMDASYQTKRTAGPIYHIDGEAVHLESFNSDILIKGFGSNPRIQN